jgi:hypothetical protein
MRVGVAHSSLVCLSLSLSRVAKLFSRTACALDIHYCRFKTFVQDKTGGYRLVWLAGCIRQSQGLSDIESELKKLESELFCKYCKFFSVQSRKTSYQPRYVKNMSLAVNAYRNLSPSTGQTIATFQGKWNASN